MTVCDAALAHKPPEALPVSRVSHPTERVVLTFDEPTLVADAGLTMPGTLMAASA